MKNKMIELVIKIPERDYDLACNYPDALIATYAHYIKDGTPLTKGHGRLIDADLLLDHIEDYGEGQNKLMLIAPYYVRNAETVIKADEE